jgi:hypothetical protein
MKARITHVAHEFRRSVRLGDAHAGPSSALAYALTRLSRRSRWAHDFQGQTGRPPPRVAALTVDGGDRPTEMAKHKARVLDRPQQILLDAAATRRIKRAGVPCSPPLVRPTPSGSWHAGCPPICLHRSHRRGHACRGDARAPAPSSPDARAR